MRPTPTAASLLLLALTTAALAAGCSGSKRPYTAREDPYGPSTIQLADRRMQRLLRFDQPRTSRDDAGLLYVSVPVRAATKRPQIVNYRFTFLDDSGRELPGSGVYQTTTLESNVFQTIQGNSTSPQAADYRLDIRTAR